MTGRGDAVTGEVGPATELHTMADRVLAAVDRAAPGAQAQVMVWRTRHGLTRFANSFIHQHVGEDTVTVDLQVVVDGRVASARSTGVRTARTARSLADTTVAQARLLPPDETWPGLAPPAGVRDGDRADPGTMAATPDARAAIVRAFVDAGPGLRAAGYVDTSAFEVVFANTAGQRVEDRSTRATVDGIHQTPTSAGYGHRTSPRLADLDGSAAGSRASDLARRGADAGDLEPGIHEVVLSPECLAEMVSFLAFYGFNAKQHQEGQSFARIGEQQLDPAITIVDDGLDPRAIGVGFDHEGTPRRRVELVAGGVTTSLVHDRRTAAAAGVASTGHAIPGGETFGPVPTDLFVTPGERTPEQLVASMERGLVITSFNYVRILDPKTQQATGLTRNGTFLVEDGAVVRPVSNLRFTESFVRALAPGNVLAVGNDARYADCEFGPGLVHAPSVHLAGLTFTGGARG